MKKQPKFKLNIERDHAGDLYATTSALNSKMIWRTSESYSSRVALVNACRYIPKPAVITINLDNNLKYINKLEEMLNKIWE